MPAKLPMTRIVDLETELDTLPVETSNGAILWANVEILYTSASLQPRVSIRVPLPWSETDTDTQRRDMALQFARQLIDHACVAIAPTAPVLEKRSGILEGTVLEGISQELGIAEPTAKPVKKLR